MPACQQSSRSCTQMTCWHLKMSRFQQPLVCCTLNAFMPRGFCDFNFPSPGHALVLRLCTCFCGPSCDHEHQSSRGPSIIDRLPSNRSDLKGIDHTWCSTGGHDRRLGRRPGQLWEAARPALRSAAAACAAAAAAAEIAAVAATMCLFA